MMEYDYYSAMYEDIKAYIQDNVDKYNLTNTAREELEEQLHDEMWTADSVTGNGSGSYTFSAQEAAEYICHNLDLLAEAVEVFGGNIDVLKDGAEACDVTIRCYLLGQVLSDVLDELIEEAE